MPFVNYSLEHGTPLRKVHLRSPDLLPEITLFQYLSLGSENCVCEILVVDVYRVDFKVWLRPKVLQVHPSLIRDSNLTKFRFLLMGTAILLLGLGPNSTKKYPAVPKVLQSRNTEFHGHAIDVLAAFLHLPNRSCKVIDHLTVEANFPFGFHANGSQIFIEAGVSVSFQKKLVCLRYDIHLKFGKCFQFRLSGCVLEETCPMHLEYPTRQIQSVHVGVFHPALPSKEGTGLPLGNDGEECQFRYSSFTYRRLR